MPENSMKTVTIIPRIKSHFGCLYSPTISFFWEAMSIIVNVIGRTRPFNAPVRINRFAGFPINRKISPEISIKMMLNLFRLFSIRLLKLDKKVKDVYEAPTTDEIEANNRTQPKNLYPI